MTRAFRTSLTFVALLAITTSLVACGDDDFISLPDINVDASEAVRLDGFREPTIAFDPESGTTTVVVQLVARDGVENPLHADDLEVNLRINGAEIDVESVLREDSEALASNLHLTLVLDTSFSMLQHEPAAFLPMLSSARQTTGAGKSLYVDRPGVFDWDLVWFNDRIFRPLESAQEDNWLETDIERIPSPDAGTFTKLHAALASAIQSSAAHATATNAGIRDQHLVVVFSDGADNYSWFDNSSLSGTGSIGTNREYSWTGAEAVTRADVEQLLRANPAVQLHAMGLGSKVNDGELAQLAQAGSGRYFKNVDSSGVDVLFDQVTREFTSVQTHGATIPLPPGDYTFEVLAIRDDTGARASFEFRFRGGEVGARLID